jgi:hypothetical protein
MSPAEAQFFGALAKLAGLIVVLVLIFRRRRTPDAKVRFEAGMKAVRVAFVYGLVVLLAAMALDAFSGGLSDTSIRIAFVLPLPFMIGIWVMRRRLRRGSASEGDAQPN